MNNDELNNDELNNAMTNHDPHDELNPQHELASAYLDGVASPAERATVEASADLRAVVASFTDMRAQLADVSPVTSDAREAALAAALAEFDQPALVPAATGAAIIPLRATRRWSATVLSVAAAVLLIGAVGVAVKGGLSGSDSKSSGSTLDSSAKVAAADAATESQISPNSPSRAPASTIGSIGAGAQAALIIDTPEQLQAFAATSLADAAPTADFPETTAAAGEDSGVADTTPDQQFNAGTRSAFGCLTAQQVFLADIQYQGAFAIAARDTVTGMTSAITDDCTVLATVGP